MLKLIHHSLLALPCVLAFSIGCGDDDKSTDGTTQEATHGGDSSGGEHTSAATTTMSATTDSTSAAPLEPPAAPTDLAASILEGGVHLTWKDASDNEDNFVVENKAAGETDFSLVIELPFDSVTYHDLDVTPGTEYTYRVKAVNVVGESLSNEVVIQVP